MALTFDTELLDDSTESIEKAAELIKKGELIGMPTETVYGLAANAFSPQAVLKIFKAKNRPADNPLIVHISDMSMISDIAAEISQLAVSCAKKFWPGPLTMILPKTSKIPEITSGGLPTVGVRMPSHPTALALINAAGVPLAAPSANLSGSPSPTTAEDVMSDMKGRIPAVINGGECEAGVESTVICFTDDAIKILRPGRITKEMLEEVSPEVIIDKGVMSKVENSEPAASPGMKYKHYSPKAEVFMIDGTAEQFRHYIREQDTRDALCIVFDSSDMKGLQIPFITIGSTSEEQAHGLFSALRSADKHGAKVVYARCPSIDGVGLAVYNRLIRAAAFRVITL